MAASPVFSSAASGRHFVLFPPPAPLLAQLRETPKLGAITPASRLEVRPAPEMVASGIAELDALTGGWPRGCLSEICGAVSSGRTSIVLAALAQATRRGEACALVDASDALDPVSAEAAGIEMGRMLWVRCGKKNSPPSHRDTEKASRYELRATSKPVTRSSELAARSSKLQSLTTGHRPLATDFKRLEQVLKITDLLLQSNGFGMIVLDLADIPVRSARRIPLASWFRFRRAVEHTPTVMLVIEQQPIAGSCSSLLVRVTGHGSQVAGGRSQGAGEKPSAVSSQVTGDRAQVTGKKPSAVSTQRSASRAPGVARADLPQRERGLARADPSDQKIANHREVSSDGEIGVSRLSHTELLDGFQISAELLRSRLERKPAQPVVNFRTHAKWAG